MSARFPEVVFLHDEAGRALAEGSLVHPSAHLAPRVTVYPKVEIGANCVILDGAVLGRPPIPTATTTRPVRSEFASLTLGEGTTVGGNAVLYTGSTIGRNVLIGDLASIREACEIGDGAVIGRGVMMLYHCTVGAYSRIQDQCHLVGEMVIEDHVFMAMGVMTANDNDVYRNRFGKGELNLKGPTIRRYAVIGTGAVLLPGVEIGEGAMVAAGATVTKDVEPWTIVAGTPARKVKDIPPEWRVF